MTLSPSTTNIQGGSSVSININTNTNSSQVLGFQVYADITGTVPSNIVFNPKSISGLQTAFNQTTDSTNGKLLRVQINAPNPTIPYSTNGSEISLGTLTFTAPTSGTMNFNFNTTFTKINEIGTNNDILLTPNNATYTFVGTASPAPTPSPTAQPSATPVASATLQFSVKFEGVSAPSADNLTKTVKVYINQAPPKDVLVTWSASNGFFTSSVMNNLSPGSARICVKGPAHLSKCFADVLSDGANTRNWTTNELLAGDTAPSTGAGFNKVEILDYAQFVVDFQGTSKVSDFNFDGVVNVMDYSFIVKNFGLQGEQ
jgi:hypothetical protein